MSKKENSITLSICIPHTVYFHSVVDMFKQNNIKVHDLRRATKEGHLVELEFSKDFIINSKETKS